MTEYWIPREHTQILNINGLNKNMHNSNFKGFASSGQGTHLNFGWGSIQEWGFIQVDTVSGSFHLQLYKEVIAFSNILMIDSFIHFS